MRETYQTPARLALDLRLPAGSIEIDAAETTETELELEPRDDVARELLESARVELREVADGHELVVDTGEKKGLGFFLGRGGSFRLRLRCPQGAHAVVRSKSADLLARGRLGSLEVKTASGDVSVDEVEGAVRVHSASGDLELRLAHGVCELNTVSGDVLVSQAKGPVRANAVSGDVVVRESYDRIDTNSVSGDQRIDALGAGPATLQTVSGDVQVGIRRGLNVWMDVRSVSGDTTSELTPDDTPPADDAPVVELRIKAVSGDVQIHRAPAATAAQIE